MFKEYKFGSWRREIRGLLRERMALKDRIRYHLKRIKIHESKINSIKLEKLVKLENELNTYLERAGN